MALSDLDRNLIARCLAHKPHAWEDFVDRFLGVVLHVVDHTASSRSLRLSAIDRDDLVADVFLAVLDNDLAVLRRFAGNSSLATYLTVVARRVVVRRLLAGKSAVPLAEFAGTEAAVNQSPEQRITARDEVEHLIGTLDGQEAEVVRMYHLEGKTYDEISRRCGVPANSVGPLLSRARLKMRRRADQTT